MIIKFGCRLPISCGSWHVRMPHALISPGSGAKTKTLCRLTASEDAVLLQQHGDQHEIAHLQHLEAKGKDVIRVETEDVLL